MGGWGCWIFFFWFFLILYLGGGGARNNVNQQNNARKYDEKRCNISYYDFCPLCIVSHQKAGETLSSNEIFPPIS